jgi:SAM-dependent methyltransferase
MGDKLFGIIPRKTLNEPDFATGRILNDKFLNELYSDEISEIKEIAGEYDPVSDVIVEIGAAGGNTKSIWPEAITTDVRQSIGVDKVMSAEKITFADSSIKTLFGLDALHHVRDPERHFEELNRTLAIGGKAIYIEPNWNFFSRLCFAFLLKYLHPEPYDVKKQGWVLDNPDPMMGNQSQAFNIFVRDAVKFNNLFPNLKVEVHKPIKGLSFLLSGGVHTRLPIPSAVILQIYRLENKSNAWLKIFGLGRIISLTKLS